MLVGLSDSYKGLRVVEAGLQPSIPDAVPRSNRGLPPSSEGRQREMNAVARQWTRLGAWQPFYRRLLHVVVQFTAETRRFPQLAAPATRVAANGKTRDISGKADKLEPAGRNLQ